MRLVYEDGGDGEGRGEGCDKVKISYFHRSGRWKEYEGSGLQIH